MFLQVPSGFSGVVANLRCTSTAAVCLCVCICVSVTILRTTLYVESKILE